VNYEVIDSDNYGASGIKTFFFPGGEPHAQILTDYGRKPILLVLKLRTWNDVGLAMVVMDALRRADAYFRVFIPYFPGARQDRSDGTTPLTAELMMDVLFGRATCWRYAFDVHSGCILGGFNWVLMPSDLDLSSLKGRYDGVIAPDAGARSRAENFADAIGVENVLVAEKVREFGSGQITSYKIEGAAENKRYLVVDDICDGGATFNLLAGSLPVSARIDLWVSHGIFSKGVSNLSTRYETIYTTDSWYQPDQVSINDLFLKREVSSRDRVTVFPLSPLFNKIW
jgi:ribose-phosphate pyrophosphokinase